MDERNESVGRKRPRAWEVCLETGALALSTTLLGVALQPEDPFFTRNAFAWSALGPLLAGLRHGFGSGLGCALALVLALFGYQHLGGAAGVGFPAQFSLGVVVVGMISGEFRDKWARKLERSAVERAYHQQRLGAFSRVYHLLRVSHDRLEQRAARGIGSLRHALAVLKERMVSMEVGAKRLEWLGDTLLQLCATHCGVQAASLHVVDALGMVGEIPAARLGEVGLLVSEDALIQQALSSREVVVRKEPPGPGSLLAMVPLLDLHGQVHGLIAVYRMHFPSIQADTFRTLALLGAYAGDLLARGTGSSALPSAAFRNALRQNLHDQARYGLPASVLYIRCQDEQGLSALRKLSSRYRSLDEPWLTRDGDGKPVLLTLLPLTDAEGAGGCERRLEQLLSTFLDETVKPTSFTFQTLALDASHRVEDVLERLLGRLHVENSHAPAGGRGPDDRVAELEHPPLA